jgi:hypothetical protein
VSRYVELRSTFDALSQALHALVDCESVASSLCWSICLSARPPAERALENRCSDSELCARARLALVSARGLLQTWKSEEPAHREPSKQRRARRACAAAQEAVEVFEATERLLAKEEEEEKANPSSASDGGGFCICAGSASGSKSGGELRFYAGGALVGRTR